MSSEKDVKARKSEKVSAAGLVKQKKAHLVCKKKKTAKKEKIKQKNMEGRENERAKRKAKKGRVNSEKGETLK